MDFSIGSLRRRAGVWLAQEESCAPGVCGGCGSGLVQPQGWKELPSGDLLLRLRCPECMVVTSGAFGHGTVAEYDADMVRARDSMVADYEAIVRHNMAELLERFRRALELDLISAGDFETRDSRTRGRAEPRGQAPGMRVESL